MQKITTHLWFDTQAKEASEYYVSLFDNSKIINISTISGTPSGDCDIVSFNLAGLDMQAISAGPIFKINPSISFFVTLDTVGKCDKLWASLSQDAKVLMEYNTYPFAKKYGWLQDKFGVSWQISLSDQPITQTITPSLLFTQDKAGKAAEFNKYYTEIFPNSKINLESKYEKGEPDVEGYLKYSNISLDGCNFTTMDSSAPHQFTFNEAVSLVVHFDTQEEIDKYWEKISAVPESEQCGWCKDKFGVSWQIVPTIMDEMLGSGDKAKIDKVTKAFLQMKKFDIETLKKAYES